MYTGRVGNRDEFSTWVEIDLKAIENNVRLVLQQTRVTVMAVVKANAYGHGAVPVARAAMQGGASWLGVARVEEALELRAAGLNIPTLLLGYTPPNKVREVITQQISMTVWNTNQILLASTAADQVGLIARLHLKIDTGMRRIGVLPEEAVQFSRFINQTPGVQLEGIFTHFAYADELDTITTSQQEQLFRNALEQIHPNIPSRVLVHASNSAASLTRPSAHFDMVRLGIAMYGLQPSNEIPLNEGFRPALTWKTVLSQIKIVPSGNEISYGHEYVTRAEERIGTIPLGYADGFRRIPGSCVLVRGYKVPVVGTICMDQCMLNLDAVPECAVGDEVVIIGSQDGKRISADELAKVWGTINYEVVCGIVPRVPRVYRQS
jgi:alanine racemase